MFTPGPWEINEDTVYGNPVLEISSNAADQWIAHVLNTDYVPGENNANLIVAAPDMYEALKNAVRNIKIGGTWSLREMESALAKAEGRQPE